MDESSADRHFQQGKQDNDTNLNPSRLDEFEVADYEETEQEIAGGARPTLASRGVAPPPSLSPYARPESKMLAEEPRSAIFETRIDAAASHRAAGNELFKAGRWADARACYERGLLK